MMKQLLGPTLAALLAIQGTTALAGGPVVVDDKIEMVADGPASSVGALPVILMAVALCAALCGSKEQSKPVVCEFDVAC